MTDPYRMDIPDEKASLLFRLRRAFPNVDWCERVYKHVPRLRIEGPLENGFTLVVTYERTEPVRRHPLTLFKVAIQQKESVVLRFAPFHICPVKAVHSSLESLEKLAPLIPSFRAAVGDPP